MIAQEKDFAWAKPVQGKPYFTCKVVKDGHKTDAFLQNGPAWIWHVWVPLGFDDMTTFRNATSAKAWSAEKLRDNGYDPA